MGITPAELNVLSAPVFWEAIKVHEEEKNADRRHLGELIRGATLRLFNTQIKTPIREPGKFWEMPWDKESEEKIDIEEMLALPKDKKLAMAEEFAKKNGIING